MSKSRPVPYPSEISTNVHCFISSALIHAVSLPITTPRYHLFSMTSNKLHYTVHVYPTMTAACCMWLQIKHSMLVFFTYCSVRALILSSVIITNFSQSNHLYRIIESMNAYIIFLVGAFVQKCGESSHY